MCLDPDPDLTYLVILLASSIPLTSPSAPSRVSKAFSSCWGSTGAYQKQKENMDVNWDAQTLFQTYSARPLQNQGPKKIENF